MCAGGGQRQETSVVAFLMDTASRPEILPPQESVSVPSRQGSSMYRLVTSFYVFERGGSHCSLRCLLKGSMEALCWTAVECDSGCRLGSHGWAEEAGANSGLQACRSVPCGRRLGMLLT